MHPIHLQVIPWDGTHSECLDGSGQRLIPVCIDLCASCTNVSINTVQVVMRDHIFGLLLFSEIGFCVASCSYIYINYI